MCNRSLDPSSVRIGNIDVSDIKEGSVFIDETTGDAFKWSKAQKLWSAALSTGIYTRYSIQPERTLVHKNYPRQLLSVSVQRRKDFCLCSNSSNR